MARVLVIQMVNPDIRKLTPMALCGHRGEIINLTTGEVIADIDNQLTMAKLNALWEDHCYRGHRILYEQFEGTDDSKKKDKEKSSERGYKKYSNGKRVW